MTPQVTGGSSSPRDETLPTGPPSDRALIVGVGASAGGLEALELFFDALPSDTGAAFVVIQHLSPEFKSHMEELLGRHTKMPIHRVVNGMKVEPDHIYLIPPKMEMVITDGRLLITEKGPERKLSHPIDQFFRSLASERQTNSVGVILSGTGSDGSRGIREISQAGGIVLAQDLKTAKFDGMPANAQATGVVNLTAAPDQLARALQRYIQTGFRASSLIEIDEDLPPAVGVEQIFELLRNHSGLDFSYYKSGTVARRIERRIQLGNYQSLDRYIHALQSSPGELHELYKDLLIGVTKFFRDPVAFEHLRLKIIPKLVDDCPAGESVRVWCAGCATGEEAYSIAILLDEYISKHKPSVDVKVFATDVHQKSLNIATRGVYSSTSVTDVGKARLEKYFRHQRDEYHISRELRKKVLFAPQNVISDAPFTQMDLVVCRNLLIYLQPQPQKKVLAMFHFALKTGGVLFLGPSETPGDLSNEFQAVEGRWRIYRKRRDVRLPLDSRVPILMAGIHAETPDKLLPSPVSANVDRRLLTTYDHLLDRFMPASILVDETGELVHCFAGAERFLKMRAGRLTSNVIELVEDALRLPIANAVNHARKLGERVRLGGISLKSTGNGDKPQVVAITVEPVYETSPDHNHFLIMVETVDQATQTGFTEREPKTVDLNAHDIDVEHVKSLESELRFTKENLQATIEELETSNEELQATNEELVASNEELQSTNEELHSVNEELYTVNAEHQRRVEELAEANEDMDNLLAATRVGVIFLDNDLYIRRFTPEISRVFHLVSQDVGRSIRSFAHDLSFPTLVEHLDKVLETRKPYEREVTDQKGRTFIARMNAYTSDRHYGGVVLTLIEITEAKQLQAEAKRLASVIDVSPDFVAMMNERQEIIYLNQAARRMFNLPGDSKLNQLSLSDFLTASSTTEVYQRGVPEALRSGLWSGETELKLPDGSVIPVSQVIVGHSGNNESGDQEEHYISTVARDLTDIRRSQEILEQSEAQLRRIIDNMLGFVGVLDVEGTLLEANYAATEAGGIQRADVIGKKFWECDWWAGNHFEVDRLQRAIVEAKRGSVVRYDAMINAANGSTMEIDFMLVPVRDDSGNVVSLIPSGFDITGRKEAERGLMLRQAAIDSASSGIIITDPTKPDCPITYVNHGFTAVTGYTQEDSIGKNCRFLQGPNTDQDDVLLLREAIQAGEATRVTLLNYRKNGEPFWNDLQITPVRDEDGNLTNFVGVQHDVSEQVAAEEQMREAAERIQAVLDSTAEGIYGVDNQGRCTFCNAASLRLLGLDCQEQLIGRDMHQLIHLSKSQQSSADRQSCTLCHALETGERVNVDTEYLQHADGSRVQVEYWSHPIRRGEKVVGAVVTFVDISRRKQQHEELQQARETADLANKAKSRFLANMSHELRTPVAVVLGFADILLQESTDEQVRKRVTVIKRNSDYLLKLLNDILDLSRVEAGAVQVEESSCDLQMVLQDLHEMMQVRATEMSRPLSFHLPPKMPKTITTDPARLRQIAVNLIGNAIKFSPRGRVDVYFDMTTLKQKNAIRIRVCDTGIGMSAEQIERLFQPFSQASDKIAREFGGTGLGLSICKRLVDSLGGDLEVESVEGQGSTFTATLPADPMGDAIEFQIEEGEQLPVQEAACHDEEALSARVLLADDMRDVRYVAKHFLNKAGCEVTVVENGQQAVDAITAAADGDNPFDFAIIDMQMPVMDGMGAIMELRKRGIQIPAIALTADAMKGTRKRVLEAGFDEYLAKPINSATLLRCVRQLLQTGENSNV